MEDAKDWRHTIILYNIIIKKKNATRQTVTYYHKYIQVSKVRKKSCVS